MDPKDNGFSWTWKPGEEQHPYTFSWFNVVGEQLNNVNKHQTELECELAQMDLIDWVMESMETYPDAEEIIQKVRENLSK